MLDEALYLQSPRAAPKATGDGLFIRCEQKAVRLGDVSGSFDTVQSVGLLQDLSPLVRARTAPPTAFQIQGTSFSLEGSLLREVSSRRLLLGAGAPHMCMWLMSWTAAGGIVSVH